MTDEDRARNIVDEACLPEQYSSVSAAIEAAILSALFAVRESCASKLKEMIGEFWVIISQTLRIDTLLHH